jgi:stage II sporulation protein D
VADGRGGVHVINVLDLEAYLWGVIAGEMPTYLFSQEALRSQASAARTYALWNMKTSSTSAYDLSDSPRDAQVYGGMGKENAAARRAVDSTRGVILTYKDKIIPAFYHSTCGGATANIEKLWFNKVLPPFEGVQCRNCTRSKYYRWTLKMPLKEVEARLNERGVEVKKISDIQHFGADEGGHGGFVQITGQGEPKIVTAADFRRFVNASKLRSSCFAASVTGNPKEALFEGKGFGHGVGLCQFGAAGLARQGKRYEDILTYYYPECKVVKIYP